MVDFPCYAGQGRQPEQHPTGEWGARFFWDQQMLEL